MVDSQGIPHTVLHSSYTNLHPHPTVKVFFSPDPLQHLLFVEFFDNGHSKWYAAAAAKSFQSCPTLCNPIDGSPPGSSVPGILQARTLEWIAISFSTKRYTVSFF